jgi:hypothetical protein
LGVQGYVRDFLHLAGAGLRELGGEKRNLTAGHFKRVKWLNEEAMLALFGSLRRILIFKQMVVEQERCFFLSFVPT